MKKLFLLLALLGMVATGCSKDEGGRENNIPENIFFGLDKESFTFSPDGGSVDVIVYSNYKWEISGTSDWCTPSVKGGDANEDGQKVTFSADVAYDDREATFWFRCADEKIKFVVSQKLKEVIIPDAKNTFNIPAEGGVAVISYQTNINCEVIIPDEAQDWITIAPATRGLVSENINLDIAENTTYSSRTAVIKVVAKDNAELAVEYTINQEQNDAILADGNTKFTIEGWEQQITIEHKANVNCDVIIPDDAQDWVTIVPATRGLVTYNTTLNIAENNSGKERSCVIKVVSKDDNELFAEYTITQNSRYCLYYTSSNGKIVTPYDSSAFGATILSNTYIGGVGTIDFNAPITMIGEYAFYKCSNLTSVTIPNSVTTIGTEAFYKCSSLTGVTIPNNVTTIERYAFKGCSSLTSVTIPDSVTEIGYYAFAECSSLTSVTIGDSVTTIGGGAFTGCNRLKEFKGKFASEDGRCLIIDGELNSFAPVGLTEYTIPDSVTTIGNYAFRDCDSLISVTIPNSVTEIGGGAFESCSSLTSVTIPDCVTTIGDEAFEGCSSLTSVTIPDSVTTIGDLAFYRCESLTSVTIPDSVTKIGSSAFYGCTGELIIYSKIIENNYTSTPSWLNGTKFTKLTIGDSVTTIGKYTFYGCESLTSVTIPDSVTSIGDLAFNGCTGELIINSKIIETDYTDNNYPSYYGWLNGAKFTKLTIGNSVTTIGEYAFRSCGSLTSVTIGNSVTTIGTSAFYSCDSLTSVTIPDSVTKIGNSAFAVCSNLTSVTIPNSVTSIGNAAFYQCDSLTSVTIPDSVTTIGNSAFSGCNSLKSATIGDSVTTIGVMAFYECSSLKSVTIGNSVTSIEEAAFAYCSSLTSVTIGDSVTTIGKEAFFSCSSLTSVTIPDSVTSIGDGAFSWCDSLTSVYCKATTPPAGGSSMFGRNASGREIYVPMWSAEAYKSASGWSKYADDIIGYNF